MHPSTPARTSARSSASSIGRTRLIPVEVAVELRPAEATDLPAIQSIYAHHVMHGLASFEEEPPSVEELGRRYRDVIGRGLPYLVAEFGTDVAGYGYCSPYRARS